MYNVLGPGHLWHADGCHKLRRWGLVVHSGIDGFSRVITFIRCSDNNRATTALAGFLEGVRDYGCPSRLRMDRGGENVAMADYMIVTRGADRNSAIFGSSTHNQRIERVWRDVTKEVLDYYRILFTHIEDYFRVDVSQEWVMFLFHYLFLPSINKDLQLFKQGWNSHSLSTENNQTPHQLMYKYANVSDAVFVDPDEYGVEESEYEDEPDTQVIVDPVQCPFNEVQRQQFETVISPIHSTLGLTVEELGNAFQVAATLARQYISDVMRL